MLVLLCVSNGFGSGAFFVHQGQNSDPKKSKKLRYFAKTQIKKLKNSVLGGNFCMKFRHFLSFQGKSHTNLAKLDSNFLKTQIKQSKPQILRHLWGIISRRGVHKNMPCRSASFLENFVVLSCKEGGNFSWWELEHLS